MSYRWIWMLACTLGLATGSYSEAMQAEGEALFTTHCSGCHGADGKGDGAYTESLATQPADLTKIAARRDGVWPMLEVMSIIDGYTKRTQPREDMPIIQDLFEGPLIDFETGNGLVTRVPASLVALASYLESIQSPPPESYAP